MNNKILQKLNRANDNNKNMTINIVVEDEILTSQTISLSQHEVDALVEIINNGDTNFVYALKDTSNQIKDILSKKSKDMVWRGLNK